MRSPTWVTRRPATRSVSRMIRLLSYSERMKTDPTDILDMTTKNIPPSLQNDPNIRLIFEATIVANTARDEAASPRIHIINEVDEDPSPPMSFYYTNNLYCGSDISVSSPLKLIGCDCKGACNPNDQSCACVRRQEESARAVEGFEDHRGFLYDEGGCVREHGLPVFECNVTCRCSDKCSNKVSLRPTPCITNTDGVHFRSRRRVESMH